MPMYIHIRVIYRSSKLGHGALELIVIPRTRQIGIIMIVMEYARLLCDLNHDLEFSIFFHTYTRIYIAKANDILEQTM